MEEPSGVGVRFVQWLIYALTEASIHLSVDGKHAALCSDTGPSAERLVSATPRNVNRISARSELAEIFFLLT